MNFLKIYSKFSRLSYTPIRTFAGDAGNNPKFNPQGTPHKVDISTGIGGEKRNTSSETMQGEAPYKHTGDIDELVQRGAASGDSRGETISNRNTVLDTASGKGGVEKGRPKVPPTGLSEDADSVGRGDSGVASGGKAVTNEGLDEGPGTMKSPKSKIGERN